MTRPRRSTILANALVVATLAITVGVATRPISKPNRQATTSTAPTTRPSATTSPSEAATTARPSKTTPAPTSTTVRTAPKTNPATDATPTPTTADNRDTPPMVRRPVTCATAGQPTTGTVPSPDPTPAGRWTTAGSLSGNCDAHSQIFHLRGIDTRLTWRSDTSEFVVWVVDTRGGLDVAGGFADIECSARCADQRSVTLQAGDYYLQVQASNAPWQVSVQEYRAS